MANTPKKANTANQKEQVITPVVEAPKSNEEIELLKAQNEALQSQMAQLMEMFQNSMNKKEEVVLDTAKSEKVEEEIVVEDTTIPEAPPYNKQIKVMSLSFGSLNLNDGTGGKPRLMFKKFGEVKTVLYSTLIEIVNNNKSFADNGLFYILDKSAVYHLDLTEQYEKIVDKQTIDRLIDMEDWEILAVTKDMLKTQKDMIVELIRERAYRDSKISLNKVTLIGQQCGHPNIVTEIQEMRKFSNLDKG